MDRLIRTEEPHSSNANTNGSVSRTVIPELFGKAAEYEEKVNYRHTAMQDRKYTWSHGESLHELIQRRAEIEAKHRAALERAAKRVKPNRPLLEILIDAHNEEDDEAGCAVCHL